MTGLTRQLSVDSYFETNSKRTNGFYANSSTNEVNKRKLVLHFDQHNTIQVACTLPGRCITVEEGLNNFLTCAVWGKEVGDQWVWCCNEPQINKPKGTDPEIISYFKYLEKKIVKSPDDRAELKKQTCRFVFEEPGSMFKEFYDLYLDKLIYQENWYEKANEEEREEEEKEELSSSEDENANYYLPDRKLSFSESNNKDSNTTTITKTKKLPSNTIPGNLMNDKSLYHLILPEFFDMIRRLQKENRDFVIILRTMGIDSHNFLENVKSVLHGKHRDFKDLKPMEINMNVGQLKRYGNDRIELNMDGIVYKDEKSIYDKLNSLTGICAIRDDFAYWQKHNYECYSAKPLWVDLNDDKHHHIIFDDNIRFDSVDDCIVNLRYRDRLESTSCVYENIGFESYNLFGKTSIIQPNLIELLNPFSKRDSTRNHYFDKIKAAERFYDIILQNTDKIRKEIVEEEISESDDMSVNSDSLDASTNCLNSSTRKLSIINLYKKSKSQVSDKSGASVDLSAQNSIPEEDLMDTTPSSEAATTVTPIRKSQIEQQQQQKPDEKISQSDSFDSNMQELIQNELKDDLKIERIRKKKSFIRLNTSLVIEDQEPSNKSSTICSIQ